MTEPSDVQTYERIASDYGWDPAKIIKAAQAGIISANIANLAITYIDHMRPPAQTEQSLSGLGTLGLATGGYVPGGIYDSERIAQERLRLMPQTGMIRGRAN